MKDSSQTDYNKPVAYSPEGLPLYARPDDQSNDDASSEAASSPQVVYLTRAIDPHQQTISTALRLKHDESARQYPQLNLSEGEYVISAVKRHPIGLLSIWLVVALAITIVLGMPAALVSIDAIPFTLSGNVMLSGITVLLLVVVLLVAGGVVATVVYDANRFYLTNESVTQFIQTSLFSKKNQTISLGNIEDASFQQQGIVQTILNYGAIRLSTEGEETTYRFNFVANPQAQIRLLNDAVEGFKNFRPINDNDD